MMAQPATVARRRRPARLASWIASRPGVVCRGQVEDGQSTSPYPPLQKAETSWSLCACALRPRCAVLCCAVLCCAVLCY